MRTFIPNVRELGSPHHSGQPMQLFLSSEVLQLHKTRSINLQLLVSPAHGHLCCHDSILVFLNFQKFALLFDCKFIAGATACTPDTNKYLHCTIVSDFQGRKLNANTDRTSWHEIVHSHVIPGTYHNDHHSKLSLV